MDEYWRMRTEMPTPKLSNHPPRRSTEYTATSHLRKTVSDDLLIPDDFTDVFGGPPRTILSRHFPTTAFFYEDIFWQPEKTAPAVRRSGRNLPLFRIPSAKQSSSDRYQPNRQNDGFFRDIFGWDAERVMSSRSMSKTSSSSALSSEELSPLRPAVSDDGYDDVSLFASKLRSRWNSARIVHEDHRRQQKSPAFPGRQPLSNSENASLENLRNCPFRFSRRNPFPERINLEQMGSRSFRMSPDDLQFNSPVSSVSSVSRSEREAETCEIVDEILRQEDMEEDDNESMSSYVIEINPGNSGMTCEENGVDEAIAWAKEKFQTHCSEQKPKQEMQNEHRLSERPTYRSPSVDEQQDKRAAEDKTTKIQEEMHLLDEKIKLWLTGKESDIRLLLSSLHQILWPNSGWLAIPLMNLIESSQVKKAYQKAVLCLHPDKLQQRGATLQQRYIAEKAFSALQDAWAAFISLDVFCP